MNIATYSPALVVLYVMALLIILMDVDFRSFSLRKNVCTFAIIVCLAIFNHLLRSLLGSAVYGKLLLITMHLPTFLIFLNLTKCSLIKMTFMILTALVFTAPPVLIGNLARNVLFVGSTSALLLSNLFGYAVMLLAAQIIFRKGFNYLLKHGDDSSFLTFSLIPLLYYFYVFAATNIDFSAFNTPGGLLVRWLPTMEVFVFYFLLLDNYKKLSEKKALEASQTALNQKLSATKEQISLLNEARTQMAVYQHDMRHHLTVLDSLLASQEIDQVQDFIQKIHENLDSITPKRFCGNDLVNLLCSSFAGKAERSNVRLTVEAGLPKQLSISDTELCSLLSNGLENALHAVSDLTNDLRWIEFYCTVKHNKLLIEIQNPFMGTINFHDDLPVSDQIGHGYGCQSIRAITERYHGHCAFEPIDGIFTLRVVLPLSREN